MAETPAGRGKHAWWKESVVYQIYPASFQDSNGDGWGDIPGILSRLDYLKALGIDIVWVSPIYKSPQADMGYDISDYRDIDPKYGTMGDVETLIAELGKRDMKLMMDLVVNHTSDQHPWFLESRSSKDNPKRGWYVWKPPRTPDGGGPSGPPNNWSQILGEANSAWTFDKHTQEYYLSLFTPEQPDLNWENPDVRAAVVDIMIFWMKKGICGFRMDVINMISKVQSFPDAEPVLGPGHKFHPGTKFFFNGPRMHEFLRQLNREVLKKYDSITVGEMPAVNDIDEIIRTVGSHDKELRMIFIFDLVDVDNAPGSTRMTLHEWKPKRIKEIVSKWQRAMIEHDGWNSIFIENHDNPRSVSRYTDDSDEYREKGAKLLALMELTLGGTLFVYQGEEIGMRNVPMAWDPSEYKDIESINFWKKVQQMYPGDKQKLEEGRKILQLKARDHARTPMQWSAEPNAGFCPSDVLPWMRVNDDYKEVNTETQRKSSTSEGITVWEFWKQGLERRKSYKDVFVYGDYQELNQADENVFAYTRTGDLLGKWIVVLNWTGEERAWNIPTEVTIDSWETGTYQNENPLAPESGGLTLKPWEGLLGKCR